MNDNPNFVLSVGITDRQVYFNQILTGATGQKVPDIHGDDRYIVVEFAGAIASVAFYVSALAVLIVSHCVVCGVGLVAKTVALLFGAVCDVV